MTTVARQYAVDVVSKKIETCELTQLACARFLRDLEQAQIPSSRFVFNEQLAQCAIDFIEELEHTKGALAGKKLILQPWQVFIVANIFGWVYRDGEFQGKRRFTQSYIEVPRKNGKSTLASAILLVALLIDGESSAEVYSAATKLSQAAIIFEEAARVCKQVPMLKEIDELEVFTSVNNRIVKFGNSFLKPLEWNPATMDGLNTHFCAVDEYHAHRNDDLYNVIRNSMGSRAQPHMFTITTAGFDKNSPCHAHRKYCTDVLRENISDDSLFTIIYTIDADDDWRDFKIWKKANPNFGISAYQRIFDEEFTKAKERTTKEVEFKTKLLNIWTDAADVWIRDIEVKAVMIPKHEAHELARGRCLLALDLASNSDFCALTAFFPDTNYSFTKFWIPEEYSKKRDDATGEAIRQWCRDGFITVTDGNVTDYKFIKNEIIELCETFDVQLLAYDRWNSSQLIIELSEAGVECHPFGQGFSSMNAPTKYLELLIKTRDIQIQENPVMIWMFGNVAIVTDPAGNIKIDKSKASDKVDGIVSLIMSLGAFMALQKMDAPEYNEFFVQSL